MTKAADTTAIDRALAESVAMGQAFFSRERDNLPAFWEWADSTAVLTALGVSQRKIAKAWEGGGIVWSQPYVTPVILSLRMRDSWEAGVARVAASDKVDKAIRSRIVDGMARPAVLIRYALTSGAFRGEGGTDRLVARLDDWAAACKGQKPAKVADLTAALLVGLATPAKRKAGEPGGIKSKGGDKSGKGSKTAEKRTPDQALAVIVAALEGAIKSGEFPTEEASVRALHATVSRYITAAREARGWSVPDKKSKTA